MLEPLLLLVQLSPNHTVYIREHYKYYVLILGGVPTWLQTDYKRLLEAINVSVGNKRLQGGGVAMCGTLCDRDPE